MCKAEPIPAVLKMLQDRMAPGAPKGGVLSILQYLRETVRADSLAAVEFTELGTTKYIVKAITYEPLDPKV